MLQVKKRHRHEPGYNWSKAPPRPDHCDWCHDSIPADQPLYYDRVWPLIEEVTSPVGTYWQERVGCFCSPDCRALHRASVFERRNLRAH
jgi:hypothetical protein